MLISGINREVSEAELFLAAMPQDERIELLGRYLCTFAQEVGGFEMKSEMENGDKVTIKAEVERSDDGKDDELDNILLHHRVDAFNISRGESNGKDIGASVAEAKKAILSWHQKQVEQEYKKSSTMKTIRDVLEDLLWGEHDDERKAIDQALAEIETLIGQVKPDPDDYDERQNYVANEYHANLKELLK